MARRRYRQRSYYRRRGRWSANIKNFDSNTELPVQSSFYITHKLCENPAQTDSTVSQQYTVKNIEYTLQFEQEPNVLQSTSVEQIQSYIMFVPQGYTITETMPFSHPEWILGYRYLGSADDDAGFYRNPIKIRTRLARRLQTGDAIYLIVLGKSEVTTSGRHLNIGGLVRWWTKAN